VRAPSLLAAGAAILLLAGCSSPGTGSDESDVGASKDDMTSGTVTVLAAASLTDVIDVLAERFEDANADVDVVASYGGSSALAEQIVSGAPVDVFFSANEATMQSVVDAGLAADPEVLVTNTLQIAVPAGNPAGITGLADFARPELTIALCDTAVPCGAAAQSLLDLAGVQAQPDTLEEDVRAALTKVSLGEADAALVYVTDVVAAGSAVEGIDVPEAQQVINNYPVALLAEAPNPDAGQAFIDYLRSDEARQVFEHAGFAAP
jgi:molybdate transport system substrate-binding protein